MVKEVKFTTKSTPLKKRDRILLKAIEAFNDKGYHAYSLSDLAEICGMSRGNLAYHYKYKEDILDDLSLQMQRTIKRYQKKRLDFPAFFNLSLDIRTCQSLQRTYPFIFRDMSVLEHGSIKEVMSHWSKEVIKRNLNAFSYGIDIGNVNPEPFSGLYYNLALNAWLLTYYWVAQESVREIGKEDVETMVWSTIFPHFTTQGKESFLTHYGEDFLGKSGISIQHYKDIQHLI